MKVKIGPYTNFIGPYQIAEKILFWKDKYNDEDCDMVHTFGKFLASKKDGSDTLLTKFCQWVNTKRERNVKIHIDGYDVWNMNNTLAMIVHPMLLKLKENKHGAPYTDDKDVPAHLRSTNAPPKENEWDIDEFHFARWEWVLDEMIWTFEQYVNEWEEQYYSGEIDAKFVPCKDNPRSLEYVNGPKHTFKVDVKGIEKHQKRMKNGMRLFAKYYDGLWD